jgi:tungstate transport system permease protein
VDLVLEGFLQAGRLILSGNRDVLAISLLSLFVSGVATLASLAIGVPIGTALALARFPGRRLTIALVNTGMGLPPVVVGLFVMLLLWRSGPLGDLRLLFTPGAMILAQFVIAAPVVIGLTMSSIQALPAGLPMQMVALGATRLQLLFLLAREARLGLLAALMAGFGSIISEVGASMMVGGNIRGETRVLTTATVMEAGRGEFGAAIALSIILMALVYAINVALTWVQQRRARH